MLKLASVLIIACAATGAAQTFERAGQDIHQRIVGETAKGEVVLIAPVGRYADVKLSADKKTVSWRATAEFLDPTTNRFETVSYRIGWYRNGRLHAYVAPDERFIRDAWLVDSGRRIGVNYGGLHFSGTNVLLDTSTGKLLASFADADKTKKAVPAWVR